MNREDFPILEKGYIYFDNGATSLKPKCVIDALSDFYSNFGVNNHSADYDMAYKVTTLYEQTRSKVASFLNADNEEIVFTSGTTDSLNMIADGFFYPLLEAGDEIILSSSEHASNTLPWYKIASEKGCKIKNVELDSNYHVTMDNLKKIVTPMTKVIALAQVTNVIGDERPIKEICKFAHENNIFVVVDAAQSAPHIKVDVKDLDCDFLALSAHKMYGPMGVGVLYGKRELLEEMIPARLGGNMNESFDNPDEVILKDVPYRLEAGTMNLGDIIAFGTSIDYLNNIGMERVASREKLLRKYLIDKLVKIPFIDIVNLEADGAIVSFNVDGIFAQDVAFYLNKYKFCVRAGNHCAKNLKSVTNVKNTVRVSLSFYNTEEEIDTFVELLSNKDKILKEML